MTESVTRAASGEVPTQSASVFQQLRERRHDAEGNGGTRIATLNFAVFVDDPKHRAWVLERAEAVVGKHPARLIVLDSTETERNLELVANARTMESATIVSERVDIGVRGLEPELIVSLADECSVPDVPTVLWWSGARLLASRTFLGLSKLASTVLVDSSGNARGEETIRELGDFVSRFESVTLKDLAFMRLLPWQDMIAQFFDDPSLREDLFSIDGLQIESGSEAEALYLAGWLGSRLSWSATGCDTFEDRCGKTVRLERAEGGGQRRVQSVVLRAGASRYRARLSEDPNVVCLDVEGQKAKAPWCVPLQNIGNTALIERAILENGRDRIFEESLATVRDLLCSA